MHSFLKPLSQWVAYVRYHDRLHVHFYNNKKFELTRTPSRANHHSPSNRVKVVRLSSTSFMAFLRM